MQDWKVFYRDDFDQDRIAGNHPSEEAALEQARELYLEEFAEIYRIEGPDGLTLPKREIMRWILVVEPAGVKAADSPAREQHPVTGNDQRRRVADDCLPHVARRLVGSRSPPSPPFSF